MIDSEIKRIKKLVTEAKERFKPSLSLRFPVLVPMILFYRKSIWYIKNNSHSKSKANIRLKHIQYRHTSPLYRKLGNNSEENIIGKINNLKIASKKINLLLIKPGETFSLWATLGNPTKSKGYEKGMILSSGSLKSGVGGGLCQLANLLTWTIMHSELEIIERHHHSLDVFPDSGRTVPFGTGATIFFPTLDFKFRNNTEKFFQLEVWLTNTQLCCKLRSDKASDFRYHIFDKDNEFIFIENKKYHHNKIYRETKKDGETTNSEFLYENTFPVLY